MKTHLSPGRHDVSVLYVRSDNYWGRIGDESRHFRANINQAEPYTVGESPYKLRLLAHRDEEEPNSLCSRIRGMWSVQCYLNGRGINAPHLIYAPKVYGSIKPAGSLTITELTQFYESEGFIRDGKLYREV